MRTSTRGKRLKGVAKGDRVYFVARDADYGLPKGTGAIIAYATFCGYKDVLGEYNENGQPKYGIKLAYNLKGPRTPIDPPVQLDKDVWRTSYVDRIPGLSKLLRNATAKSP